MCSVVQCNVDVNVVVDVDEASDVDVNGRM